MDIYLRIWVEKNSVNAIIGYVRMLFSPHALKLLTSIKKIQPRIMAATFNGNSRTKIISCSYPTNARDEMDLTTFYNELSSLVRSILKHNVLVIGGDMNAQIGKNENNKFSLHNSSNINVKYLTDFSLLVFIVTDPIKNQGGARGVIVIVVGNGHGDTSSNPG